MKRLPSEPGRFLFQLGKREKDLLLTVLRQYPLVPVAHHTLRRGQPPDADPASQKLLTEAMASNRQEQKGRVGALLEDPERFVPQGTGYRISFSREEMEWLLQVLNDVRVGSWLLLGCPDPDEGKAPEVTEANARYLFLMELSGHFECVLLAALDEPS
jgi:hypothetical protein